MLTKVKDQVAPMEQAGVVYNINCSDCPAHYVGETGEKLATRIKERQRAVNTKDQYSATHGHCEDNEHTMDWQGARVVYKESKKHNRLFLEAWASDRHSVNRKVTLNPIYAGVRERWNDQEMRQN